MGKKNRKQIKQEVKGGSNKNNLVVAAILVVVLGYWGMTQLGGSDYPNLVNGVFFDTPVVSADTGKVTVPEEVVVNSKLVFVDVKLDNVTDEFNYLGRRIILTSYRNAEYLPLVIISTPKGNTISGVRVCEPCSSFSFHIVDGKYLQCDACGTRWDIETLQGISGGCMNYPPPKLATGLVGGVVVEAGQTGLKIRV
ncbi:MAG: Fe-S-containing protein [Candidatus Bathyarchaeota archaeon]